MRIAPTIVVVVCAVKYFIKLFPPKPQA